MSEGTFGLAIVVAGALAYLGLRKLARKTKDALTSQRHQAPTNEAVPRFMRAKKAEARIIYLDAGAQRSERDISITHYTPNKRNGSFYGYCHLRKGMRTFKAARVLQLTDRETGEIISNPIKWLDER
jgi:predicted DNA-binding transcriptional regulator YafY